MPITDNDIRFRASERMTDFDDGGGRMSDVIILDGVDNNVFPDITDIERLTGKVSLRKVYAGAFNADTDTFLSSHVILDIPPTDADTSAVVFSHGGIATERQEALDALDAWASVSAEPVRGATVDYPAPSYVVSVSQIYSGNPAPQVGDIVGFKDYLDNTNPENYVRAVIVSVENLSSPDYILGLDRQVTVTADHRLYYPLQTLTQVRVYGVATAPGVTSSGATSVTVDNTASAVAANAIELPYLYAYGPLDVIVGGDAVLIHHTESMAPATVSNSQVVNAGRTGLARLRVIGSTGVEHARFTSGQTPPTGVGCTADLTAGTVTFTDVSGMAQPVTVEHRIEEMALATTVTATTVGLNRALSRAYPAGTRVSSLMMVGDLQGRATAGFAQQAWTGVWSDSIIGGTPVGDYNEASHPVECTNAGAVSERWAVIFTNTTAFRVIGEALGEIGTGSTGADYAPLNPVTGSPYFSLAAVGWGSGWASGNVYRFNTIGAVSPLWALRCVAPSTPSGDDSVTLELRGYVNT